MNDEQGAIDAAWEKAIQYSDELSIELSSILDVPPEQVLDRVRLLRRISDRCEYLGPPECGGAFAQKRDGGWSVYRGPGDVVIAGDVFEAERVRGGHG